MSKDKLKSKLKEIIKAAKDGGNEEIEVLAQEALELASQPDPPGTGDGDDGDD